MTQIEQYLNDQDFSDRTKADYRRDILAFFAFSGGEMPTAENVRAWRDSLAEKGRSSSHLARCIYAIKGYCDWMGIKIFAAPREKSRDKVRAPSLQFKEPPEVRSVEEIDRMFKACKNPRDKMILMLLATTGSRIGELTKIRIKEDIDWGNNTLALTRKGKKGRRQIVAASPATMETIKEYLTWRHGNNNLLLPFTYQELRKSFLDLAKRAKVNFPRGSLFHNLRHFFILFQKEAGVDLRFISLAVGHSSSNITDRIYGRLEPAFIHRQLHPMPWEKANNNKHIE